MKFYLRNRGRCCCLSCVNVHLAILTGQYWCRHCRGSDSPARPGSLLAGIPAAGGRLSGDAHPHRGLWRRHPGSTASPTVFLRDPWRCAAAGRLGDGQDVFRTEILPKVSEDNVGGADVGWHYLFVLLVLKMEWWTSILYHWAAPQPPNILFYVCKCPLQYLFLVQSLFANLCFVAIWDLLLSLCQIC